MPKTKENKGITLIALIITIIVLLILAGVTINALSGNDSTPAKAHEATQKMDISSAKEDCILTATSAKTDALHETYIANNANKTIAQSVIDTLLAKNNTSIGSATIEVASNGTVTISTTGYEVIGTVDENGTLTFGEVESLEPEIKGVTPQVGDIVNYSPSGTYTWDCNLAESGSDAATTTNTLSSGENGAHRITQWKILNYNPSTKKVEMVPSTVPTSSSANKLTLRGAQGYNNAVYLLNNACNSLYGNGTTITARNINEEDFIKAGLHENTTDTDSNNKWTRYRANYTNTNVTKADGTNVKYGEQKNEEYTSSTYRNYPVMYAYDNNSIINGETPSTASLGLSVQNESIASTKDGAINGYLKASTSIQPYQTYYNTIDNSTTRGLLDSAKADVLVPNSNSQYWVDSRCVDLSSDACSFYVRIVNFGYLNAGRVFYSGTNPGHPAYALFPVVSLRVKLLDLKSTSNGVQTFDVK